MDQDFAAYFRSLEEQLGQFYESMRGRPDPSGPGASLSTLLDPVEPYNSRPWMVPIVRAAGMTALVCLSGVAVGSFFVTLAALLAIYWLLSQVFGPGSREGPHHAITF